MSDGLRVTVWNEGRHEKEDEHVRSLYPNGMGGQIAQYLEKQPGIASVRVAELDDDGQGLTDAILDATDVMTWWGHRAHDEVTDENAAKVYERITRQGMGIVVLHSGHYSKIFKKLMGTGCDLKWRSSGEKERVWCVDPAHPIADGLPDHFEIQPVEMYGEHFNIPQPDQQVFISWFEGGEVFRSGCCWHRGRGQVFYWRPGDQDYPVYYNEFVLKVIANGVRWAAPTMLGPITRDKVPAMEPLRSVETAS